MNNRFKHAVAVLFASGVVAAMHPGVAAAESRDEWFQNGEAAAQSVKKVKPIKHRAKNVILFVGDGMGVSTVTAARILDGQLKGMKGEENVLSMESLPYLSLSKTYSVNQQTSDSAPTMTAMVTGVKTDDGVLSIDQDVIRGDYTTVAGNELTTILEHAESMGKSTGIISTARITHATPAACYAHSPDRDWEADSNMPANAIAGGFKDIARQLVEFPVGDGLEVALGGGRSYFLPKTATDPEDAGRTGVRNDGRNLTSDWVAGRADARYVWNKSQFDMINTQSVNHLLGLFERSHMEYEHDRPTDVGGEPSLTDMTTKAIDLLAKNKEGFFLMVEAGRIDHGHHAGNAYRALTDAIEFDEAIKAALGKVNMKDTLVIVTADHSHVFTIAGYPGRGNPILGLAHDNDGDNGLSPTPSLDLLGLPYTTLGYQNGPGWTGTSNQQPFGPKTFPHSPSSYTNSNMRPNLTTVDTTKPNYLQESAIPMGSETHAGEDVAIFAGGPSAHLFQGTVEQNVIFHVMADAFRLGSKKSDD